MHRLEPPIVLSFLLILRQSILLLFTLPLTASWRQGGLASSVCEGAYCYRGFYERFVSVFRWQVLDDRLEFLIFISKNLSSLNTLEDKEEKMYDDNTGDE